MFSKRLPKNLEPTDLNRELQAFCDLVDLTTANPTQCGFSYPDFQFRNPAVYTAAALGEPHARQAVAQARNAEHVILTASTSEAYGHLFKLLCDPGDSILIPEPSYPLIEHLAALESVQCERYTLEYVGRWQLSALEIKPRTKAIVVISPNNPTGSCPSPEEWHRLEALCLRHDLALIVDEVFLPYGFSSELISARHFIKHALLFVLEGLSKFAGLPQVKASWILASGKRVHEALPKLEWIADTYLSVSGPVQQALPELLAFAPNIQAQIKQRITTHRQMLVRLLPEYIRLLQADGGWYAVLRLPQLMGEDEWILHFAKHGVLVQPGYFFDFSRGCHVVISLIVPATLFEKGIGLLCRAAQEAFTS
jgi:alanine-synthesizing transaminase